jgi:ankyrin repeat protein
MAPPCKKIKYGIPQSFRCNISNLHHAINGVTTVNELLNYLKLNPQEAKEKDENGNYPLYLACQYTEYHYEVFLRLISIFPDAIKQEGWVNGLTNPIHIACALQKKDDLKLLLDRNILLLNNVNEDHETTLQIACRKNFENIAKLVLTYPNIDINNIDCRGDTALHVAEWQIIPTLLTYPGIDVFIDRSCGNSSFCTYLTFLHSKYVHKEHFEVMDLFIRMFPKVLNGKTPNDGNYIHWTLKIKNHLILRELLKHFSARQYLNSTDNCGKTPLHQLCSIQNNNVNCCPTQFPHLGLTCNDGDDIECLTILLQQHEILINQKCNDGQTALNYACIYGNIKMMKLLLKDPRISNVGDVPLQEFNSKNDNTEENALVPWNMDVFKQVLDHESCMILKKDKDGKMLLDIAISKVDFINTAIARGFHRHDQVYLVQEWNKIITTLETYQRAVRWKIYSFLLTTTVKKIVK